MEVDGDGYAAVFGVHELPLLWRFVLAKSAVGSTGLEEAAFLHVCLFGLQGGWWNGVRWRWHGEGCVKGIERRGLE